MAPISFVCAPENSAAPAGIATPARPRQKRGAAKRVAVRKRAFIEGSRAEGTLIAGSGESVANELSVRSVEYSVGLRRLIVQDVVRFKPARAAFLELCLRARGLRTRLDILARKEQALRGGKLSLRRIALPVIGHGEEFEAIGGVLVALR